MFIFTNFLVAIAKIIDIVLSLYMWTIIIRALLSWVNPDPYNPIVQILYKVTEPVLAALRRFIPSHRIGVDLAPLIAILIIIFLKRFLVATLRQIAYL